MEGQVRSSIRAIERNLDRVAEIDRGLDITLGYQMLVREGRTREQDERRHPRDIEVAMAPRARHQVIVAVHITHGSAVDARHERMCERSNPRPVVGTVLGGGRRRVLADEREARTDRRALRVHRQIERRRRDRVRLHRVRRTPRRAHVPNRAGDVVVHGLNHDSAMGATPANPQSSPPAHNVHSHTQAMPPELSSCLGSARSR